MPPISRPASSTYWTPPTNRQRRLSEIPPSNRNVQKLGEGDISSNISTSTSRQYVDPWDLENYAFMKRHCTDAETEYVVTSTPALESSQSDFYYVPQYNNRRSPAADTDEEDMRHFSRYVHHEGQDDSIGLVNGVEEEDFYNERYEMYGTRYSPGNFDNRGCCLDVNPRSKFKPNSCLYPRTDAGDSYEDYDDSAVLYSDDSTAMASSGVYNPRLECQLYSPSVMLRRAPSHHSEQSLVYVYETGSRRRKMALPKGNLGARATSGPPPGTLLRRNSTNSHHLTNYRQRRMLQERLSPEMYPGELTDLPLRQLHEMEPPYMMGSYDDLHHPYYDIYYSKPFPLAPQHFGLSKYGHLKIDYSFSWNSLDRYIATD